MWFIMENPWTISVGAGIISGVIVFFIVLCMAKLLFQRKDDVKHLELIATANSEVIRTLKPYIAEQGLPEKEIIDAIILSIARKYKINCEELYSIRIICEELVREIVENVYVSSSRKQEYVSHLKDYLVDLDTTRDKSLLVTEIERERRSIENADRVHYRRRLSTVISVMTSMFAFVLTALVFFVNGAFPAFLDLLPINVAPINAAPIIIAVISIATIVVSVLLMSGQRIAENLRNRDRRVVGECAE